VPSHVIAMTDPYLDVSGLLRNSLGIASQAELDVAEADITRARLVELHERHLSGEYDLAHLQAFHRELFGDVYPWAGEIRTVEIVKGNAFCPVRNIELFAGDVFSRLKRESLLCGHDRDGFVARLAEYYGDINALHAPPRLRPGGPPS